MKTALNARRIARQTKIVSLSVATASFLSLFGCAQQPPSATVSAPETTQQAKTLPVSNPTGNSETLKNLQDAYNGESNAHARYQAFAKKAQQEGYLQVARLFNAAALAESIHAANHAAAIRKMGGTPEAKLETPAVKSTKENLEAAIKGESYERDTMYPKFIEQARKENNNDAVTTLTYAVTAEAEHSKYYQQALNNLEGWKTAQKSFYVCPECGYTTDDLNFANCPECETSKNLFVVVS